MLLVCPLSCTAIILPFLYAFTSIIVCLCNLFHNSEVSNQSLLCIFPSTSQYCFRPHHNVNELYIFLLNDVTLYLGKISSWIDLDSEDETLRQDSEITLKQEIAWASHLSLQVNHDT